MTLYYVFLASALQAITEFLPISSSAHLYFVGELFNQGEDSLFFDVALHLGTVFAVLAYFYKDVFSLILGAFDLVRFKKTIKATFALNIIISSIPIAIIGFLLVKTGVIYKIRSDALILFNLVFFAIILFIADKKPLNTNSKDVRAITKTQALIVGFVQSIALCPGVSRSGITISALRFMHFDRESSARYSMLLSIPGVLGATLLLALNIGESSASFDLNSFVIGIVSAFIFGLLVISFLMNYIKKHSFTMFVVYRFILFAVLLFILF